MAYNPSSYSALRDGNRIPVATGQSNTDATQTLPFLINSVTGRLLVDSTGGTSGGGAPIYSETPSGLIDGTNRVYTTSQSITTVLNLSYNGQEIHPAEYTVSGAGFTMKTALPVIPGAAFTIVYQSGSGAGVGYQAPLTGGLTGTNTWTTAPNVIVIDNVPRQKVQTDGTVMWTGTTTTVLTGAPLPTYDIFSTS